MKFNDFNLNLFYRQMIFKSGQKKTKQDKVASGNLNSTLCSVMLFICKKQL